MIFLAKRLNKVAEENADTREFAVGIQAADSSKGKKAAIAGFVAAHILSKKYSSKQWR